MWVFLAFVGVLACSQGGEANWLTEWIPVKGGIGIDRYIVNGEESPEHMFNYQAALVIERENEASTCGGSLIAPQWVLTAAHCIENKRSSKFKAVEVKLGAHNRYEEEPTQQVFKSEKVYMHPGWTDPKRTRLVNDVALIKLDKPATINYYVDTVRLPEGDEKKETFERWPVRVSGWGVTETGSSTDKLRFMETEIISNAFCNEQIGVEAQHICTSGKEKKGLGPGDSGGPLVAYGRDGKPIQIGVNSFIHGLGDGYPSGYARVTYFLDWIKDTMEQDFSSESDSESEESD